MSEVATTNEPVSAQTLEHVLGTGDLSRLSSAQRVEYMARTCQSLGLNPLTRPFRFLSLSGQVQMYATKDATDQLRASRRISLTIVDKKTEGTLYIVTARAQTPDGRTDEDIGAVNIGQTQGEFRANNMMKAITKAKRRVTLSICGLGFLDESELDGIVGARTFDAEEQPPAISQPAPETGQEYAAPSYPFHTNKGVQAYATGSQWLERWRRLVEACQRTQALPQLREAREMNAGAFAEIAAFDPAAVNEISELLGHVLEG